MHLNRTGDTGLDSHPGRTIAWFALGFVSSGYEAGGDRISPFSAITRPISGLGLASNPSACPVSG